MFRCVICRCDDVVLDDAVAPTERGTCICCRCYARETDTQKPMPKALRLALEQTLAGVA